MKYIVNIAEDYFNTTGEELPISGGLGNSRDDPIIIDADTSAQAVRIEYKVLNFWSYARSEKFEFIKSTLFDLGEKRIEQVKIAWENDKENYYNFYFDVSKAFKN